MKGILRKLKNSCIACHEQELMWDEILQYYKDDIKMIRNEMCDFHLVKMLNESKRFLKSKEYKDRVEFVRRRTSI